MSSLLHWVFGVLVLLYMLVHVLVRVCEFIAALGVWCAGSLVYVGARASESV